MSILVASLQGRFGNACMQYLFARALAEQNGMELRVEPWIGERVFQLNDARPTTADNEAPRFNELQIFDAVKKSRREDPEDFYRIAFRGYAQCQSAIIYTKRDAQRWLKLSPEIETACANAVIASDAKDAKVVCHMRRGDYQDYGYPTVSMRSYTRACEHHGIECRPNQAIFLSEEYPISHQGHIPDDLAFMPDFYRMMTAPTLLRGNSSFSWLAALLGDGLVLSPIIDGLEGGKEHDCAFVAGNWPKFAPHLDFVTDLFVNEK